MKSVTTEIQIDASAQTIWSVLDDLDSYGLWNKVLPKIAGVTTLGRQIHGSIHFSAKEPQEVHGTILRIIGARELRWVSEVPSDPVTRAEHYFKLTPIDDRRTLLEHGELFDGPLEDFIWSMIGDAIGVDYEQMNLDLKERAEGLEKVRPLLHPYLEQEQARSAQPGPILLHCKCAKEPVVAEVKGPLSHAHLCGCSQCWKPERSLFALIAVVPVGGVTVTHRSEKLQVVNPSRAIQRQACGRCGAHVLGTVVDLDHHFYGLDFIHPELIAGASIKPEFAGFVSSIIETGANPSEIVAVRRRLQTLGIPAYDAFSPELMDIIAWHRVKIGKILPESSA
jgi:S-(hydroxymethyl)glutathione synthase